MADEHAINAFKDFMRQVHNVLNDKDVPITEIRVKLETGVTLSFTEGNDYLPPEDKEETI